MSGLAPSDTEARQTEEQEEPRVLWLDDDDAADLIGSLSSGTSRAVLTALHDEPLTASELSDRVETSLQNVRHHLNNLQDAGLVEVTDTRYSVKGREMNVYAPADDPLVVCVGREADKEGFLESLRRLVGAVVALVATSLAIQWAFGAAVTDLGGPGVAPRIGDSVGAAGGPILGVLPPGVAFLAGGLLVLALVAGWEYLR
jgi:DNA-binding transcriptional ArsR family regulator